MNNTETTKRTVAVLTVDVRVPRYAQQVYVIEQAFRAKGCEVLVANVNGDARQTAQVLRGWQGLSGVIMIGSAFSRIAKNPMVEAYLRDVPVVMANATLDLPNVRSVLLDDAGGAAQATEHLVAMGKRNLWFVQDLDTAGAIAKRDSFLSASQRLMVRGRVIEAECSILGGRKAAKELVASCRQFDGIVCGEDVTAVGVVQGLLNAGLRIPQDVAVIGYNDSLYARICEPKLTTLDNQIDFVAQSCVKLLDQMMDGDMSCENVLVTPSIVQGWTT